FHVTGVQTCALPISSRCFLELIRKQVFTREELDVPEDYFRNFNLANPTPIQLTGLKHINLKEASDKIRKELAKESPDEALSKEELHKNIKDLQGATFAHLHNYTQFSI